MDQGTQKVSEAEGFAEVKEALGGKLRIINQSNLGGSGGFARGMFEAVENGSDYVLLMDDDVVVEPESIIRLLTFADRCKTPTIVGGHMFDLYNRTVMHTFGEVVESVQVPASAAKRGDDLRHDFMSANLRQTSWLHRRVDVDYNGWWMCLVPTAVIREIGLSLPLFIKWDDAEYGLRAKKQDSRRFPCPVRRSGTFPGSTRMTSSAGRRTSTRETGCRGAVAQPLRVRRACPARISQSDVKHSFRCSTPPSRAVTRPWRMSSRGRPVSRELADQAARNPTR